MLKIYSYILVIILLLPSLISAQSIEPIPPIEGTQTNPISIEAGSLEAELDDGCPRENGKHQIWYKFNGQIGQECEITLESSDFDTYLKLTSPNESIYENDDNRSFLHPFTTNSKLTLTLQEEGSYLILVTSYGENETGAFALTLSLSPSISAPVTNLIISEETVIEGEFKENDEIYEEGRYVEYYDILFEEDVRLEINMRSDSLDCYLILMRDEEVIQQNDDFEGTDSQIIFRANANTLYTLLCTEYSPLIGSYSLTVEILPAITERDTTIYGIFCGINDYGGWGNLRYCREDAEELAQAFENRGLMSESQRIMLLDRDCSPSSIREAFEEMSEKVDSNDVFIFFYSGHGSRGRENNSNEDEVDRRQESLHTPSGAVTDDQMDEYFDLINEEALKLIVLDSCFSGGFCRDVISGPNRVGFFSSEEDMTSLVAGEFNAGGYLSLFFRRAINTGDADLNSNGIITVGEIKDYLITQYAEDCQRYSRSHDGDRSMQQLVFDRGDVRPSREFVDLR